MLTFCWYFTLDRMFNAPVSSPRERGDGEGREKCEYSLRLRIIRTFSPADLESVGLAEERGKQGKRPIIWNRTDNPMVSILTLQKKFWDLLGITSIDNEFGRHIYQHSHLPCIEMNWTHGETLTISSSLISFVGEREISLRVVDNRGVLSYNYCICWRKMHSWAITFKTEWGTTD